jgi:hypothetical protein
MTEGSQAELTVLPELIRMGEPVEDGRRQASSLPSKTTGAEHGLP